MVVGSPSAVVDVEAVGAVDVEVGSAGRVVVTVDCSPGALAVSNVAALVVSPPPIEVLITNHNSA